MLENLHIFFIYKHRKHLTSENLMEIYKSVLQITCSEITELTILVHCDLVNKCYQQNSRVLYRFFQRNNFFNY